MSPGSERTPLLADRPRNSEDSTRRAEEEDAALHGTAITPSTPRRALREVVLFAWALIATAAVIVLAVIIQHHNTTTSPNPSPAPTPHRPRRSLRRRGPYLFRHHHPPPRNPKNATSSSWSPTGWVPPRLSLTRSFRQLTQSLPIDDVLTLDRHFWGTSRTRSSNSLVTDSAAGATAFSCGRKSYNGAISMLPGHRPCGSVLEAAKRKGLATGLVVTTDVTDATPACFAAHVDMRMQMDEIALQEVGEGAFGKVEWIIDPGKDGVDVVGLAQEKHGWGYKGDRAGFDELRGGKNVSLPLLGLFADADVPFEIDRRNMADIYPSLSEMAATALTALEEATKDSDKGFFLMIEGSRIDHAGHFNDPAAQVREVLEYDKTFKLVLEFLEKSDTEGVLVATSDHETGGLSTAWQAPNELPVYNWHPSVLARANASTEYCSFLLNEHIASAGDESQQSLINWINEELAVRRLGITDALEIELNALATNPAAATVIFSSMISSRARVGWSTHGHSAVDVNIYSSGGKAAEKIRGNVENTDVGKFLSEYLDVDVDEITKELEDKLKGSKVFEVEVEGDAAMSGHPVEWLKDAGL